MYSDSKNKTICESSFVNGSKNPYNNNSYNHEKSLLSPVITSTPIHTLPMNNRRSIISPKQRNIIRRSKYELSNNSTQQIMSFNSSSPKYISHSPTPSGPLLASTNYNVNLSTYLETKSPGYVDRVVQYSEERNKPHSSSHSRYNSPGLFPIVHLTKRNTPVVSPKPRRVTVRIASSDYSPYMSPKENSSNLDDLVQDVCNSHSPPGVSNNTHSTRSVLDALKEISRKRILPREEYIVNEGTLKRTRSENIIDSTTKRTRDDKSQLDGSFEQHTRKKCNVDPHFASQSSVLMYKQLLEKLKTAQKEPATKTEKTDVSTNVDVRTQTVSTNTETLPEPPPNKSPEEEPTPNEEKEKPTEVEPTTEEPTVFKRKPVLRIFNEGPLELMRKNRLKKILNALSGEEDPVTTEDDQVDAKDNKNEEPVVVPEKTPEVSVNVLNTSSVPPVTTRNTPQITQTFTSLVTPVMSTGAGQQFTASSNFSQTSLTSSALPTFEIKAPSNTQSLNTTTTTTNSNTNPCGWTTPVTLNDKYCFASAFTNIASKATTSNQMTFQTAPATSKDSNKPENFVYSPQKSTATTFGASTTSASNTFSNNTFNTQVEKINPPVTTTQVSFPASTTTSTSLFAATTAPSFSFSSLNEISKPYPSQTVVPSYNFTFGGAATNNLKITNGTTNSTMSPNVTSSAITTPPTFSVTTNTTTPATFNKGGFSFGSNTSSFTNTSITKPSAVSTTSNVFGNKSSFPAFSASSGFNSPNTKPDTTSKFGEQSSIFDKQNAFNATSKSVFSLPPIPSTTNSTATTTTTSSSIFAFGSHNQQTTSSFGTNPQSPASGFGSNAPQLTSGFGSNNQPATGGFGLNAQPSTGSFGANAQPSTGGFGSSTQPSTGGFGSSTQQPSTGGFGASTQQPPTGGFGASTQQPPTGGFGSSTQPLTAGFGLNTQPSTGGFGANAQPSTGGFGSSTQPSTGGFGSNSQSSTGGFGANMQSLSSGFGSNAQPSTGGFASHSQPPSFGSSVQQSPSGFGATNPQPASGFGALSSSKPSSGFGSITQPTGGFGSTNQSAFGSTNVFATNNNNNNQKPSFSFGGTTQPSTNIFGSNTQTTTSSGVSSNTGGFGQTTQSSTSGFRASINFGSPPNASSFSSPKPAAAQGFSFGSAEPPKGGFNFTAPSNGTSFGSANPPTFGGNAPAPSFNAPQNMQFNAPGTPGMFNIGAGSTTNRPRTLKAKRRTDK